MSRTTSRWTRTYDDAGRVSRLVHPDGHLTVHVSYTADGRRWYYPARLSASRPYAHLADAVSAEARAYNEAMALARDALVPVEELGVAQREHIIAELARMEREDAAHQAAESTRAAERMALAERRTALRWAAGLTVAAVALVVCAGVWGVAL